MIKREVDATSVTVPEKLYGYNGYVLRVNLFNVHIDWEKYEKIYYALMDWDANGVPLPEKVEELSID